MKIVKAFLNVVIILLALYVVGNLFSWLLFDVYTEPDKIAVAGLSSGAGAIFRLIAEMASDI